MPKIIENLENRILEEAGRQIREQGYSAMTIRSVAAGCGVGVGTVYNYFPSKDSLVATYLLRDWKLCVEAIEAAAQSAEGPEMVLRTAYDQLCWFSRQHQAVFRDEAATSAFAGSFSRYHGMLRSQLAAPLESFCGDAFAREFAAEALLTWTMAGKSFREIWDLLRKIL